MDLAEEQRRARREWEIASETADLIAESASEDAPALIAAALRTWRGELLEQERQKGR